MPEPQWQWGPKDWQDLIENYFECPPYDGVYILGCFASNVTLYSQQVRALNLVYGLKELGRLKPDDKVVVIGGGAAGITAAVAARRLKCSVTLLERHAGPMQYQRNSRHRWIHPRIYDWPAPESKPDSAGLPILDWSAGYADEVAAQIEEQWKNFVRDKPINEYWHVDSIDISLSPQPEGRYTMFINHSGKLSERCYADHIIVAAGFGIEGGEAWLSSYWDGDNIDATYDSNGRWLVSGRGDGALIDLMRLCIHNFRHSDVLKYIGEAGLGLEVLGNALKEIEERNEKLKRIGRPFSTELELSHYFKESVWHQGFGELLKKHLRQHDQPVVLNYKSSAIFAGRSSILNRLIVAILAECEAFEFWGGPISSIVPGDGKTGSFEVKVGVLPRMRRFDHVVVRHGPKAEIRAVMDKWFPNNDIDGLIRAWQNIPAEKEPDSRTPHWERDLFDDDKDDDRDDDRDEAVPSILTVDSTVYGAKIRVLTFHKELKANGSSLITYDISGLEATDDLRPIEGLYIHIRLFAGIVGEPQFGGEEGLSWEKEKPSKSKRDRTEETKFGAHVLSGRVKFKEPLRVGVRPLAFTMQIPVLNGDAMTEWEFKYLYDEPNVHVDGAKLKVETPEEYTAAFVWCPVECFKMKLTLPTSYRFGIPYALRFLAQNRQGILPEEVLKNSTLYLYPQEDSKWYPFNDREKLLWKRDSSPISLDEEIEKKENGGGGPGDLPAVWEFAVDNPAVGSCYALTWSLPRDVQDEALSKLIMESQSIRRELLAYRKERALGNWHSGRYTDIDRVVEELYASLRRHQYEQTNEAEPFELEVMTFNESSGYIEPIVGTDSHGNLTPTPKFGLWFGLGLAGACYKDGGRVFAYKRPKPDEKIPWPEYYLPVRGDDRHAWMFAIPMDHPKWNQAFVEGGFGSSRSRQTVAIVVISAPMGSDERWFRQIHNSKRGELIYIHELCKKSLSQIVNKLPGHGEFRESPGTLPTSNSEMEGR